MSILGRSNKYADTPTVMEGYHVEVAGDAIAHQEFVQDMVSVYEAMHSCDIAELECRKENGGIALESCTQGIGQLEIALEGRMSDIKDRLVKALRKLWAKLKGYFASVRKVFDYMFMSGKDFVKKYQTDIIKGAARLDDDFKLEIYEYDNAKIGSIGTIGLFAKAEAIVKNQIAGEIIDKMDTDWMESNVYSKFRNEAVGDGDKDDYTKNIFKYFRSGASDKTDRVKVTSTDISTFIKVLIDDKAAKDLTKMETEMDKAFSNKIKDINKEIKDDTGSIGHQTKSITAFETCCALSSTMIRGWQQVIKERSGAYKQACMKAMMYKPKK